jgi:hypothetical protein
VKLYTASYARYRAEHGAPVVASLLVPKWIEGGKDWPRLWAATPRWSYFKAGPADFTAAYLAQLDRYGPEAIARRLAEISREAFTEPQDRLVLLCWEQSWDDCHRQLFADWLLARTGEAVTEIE